MTSLIFVSSSNYSIECPFCQFQALFSNNTSSLLLFHTSQLSWFYLLPLHFAECYFCQSHKWPSLLITVINCELHALIATGIHLWRSDALAHCFLVLVTFLLWGQHIQLSDLKGTEVYFGSKFQRPQSRHGQLAPKEKRHSERNWTMKAAHIMAEGAQRENRGAQAGRATPQWTTSSNKRTLKTPVTFWKSHSEHMKLWGNITDLNHIILLLPFLASPSTDTVLSVPYISFAFLSGTVFLHLVWKPHNMLATSLSFIHLYSFIQTFFIV